MIEHITFLFDYRFFTFLLPFKNLQIRLVALSVIEFIYLSTGALITLKLYRPKWTVTVTTLIDLEGKKRHIFRYISNIEKWMYKSQFNLRDLTCWNNLICHETASLNYRFNATKATKILDLNKVVYAYSSNWINQSTSNFIHVQPLKHEIFEVSNLTYLSDYFLNF